MYLFHYRIVKTISILQHPKGTENEKSKSKSFFVTEKQQKNNITKDTIQ